MRGFEKISFDQFKKDVEDNLELYNEFILPNRDTFHAAGYDFHAIKEFVLKPGDIKKIPTGVKVRMCNDEVLFLCVRSSQGFTYNIRLCNQIGIIDSDYYNNEVNEGHIWIALQNEGDKDYVVKKGDGIAQGIFSQFLLTDDDEKYKKIKRKDNDDYLKGGNIYE